MGQEIVFGSEDSEVVEVVEAPVVEIRKNVQKKTVEQRTEGKVGAVAHYHRAEDEFEIWDEPCYFVEHVVNVPQGIDINADNYRGKVVVPFCVADQLKVMENHWEAAETRLYRGRNFNRIVGQF